MIVTVANSVRPSSIAARAKMVDYVIPDFKELWQPELLFLPNGWAVAIADIGPELAEMMLLCNADNQRKLQPVSIGRYSSDMSSGNWHLTHQGIAFNRDGDLHDGQNRLTAIIQSGVAVQSLVFFGVGGKLEMSVTDTGKNRSAIDAAHVMGIAADTGLKAMITQALKYASTLKNNTRPFTHSSTISLLEKYGDIGKKVNSWFAGAKLVGVDRAPVRAAVLAALVCGFTESKLERFVAVLCDKIPATEVGDSAPNLLRNFIINTINKHGGSGSMAAYDLYLRTCKAIQHAANNQLCKVLRPDECSPFVMPENQ